MKTKKKTKKIVPITGEGWYLAANQRRAHYYTDGKSICGDFELDGQPEELDPTVDEIPMRGDCAACHKALMACKSAVAKAAS